MKKILILPVALLSATPVISVMSCSSAESDYFVMSWALDDAKVNNIKASDWQAFNNEQVSIDKLKKVIKGDGSYIDPYTTEAFNEGWFERISFDVNNGRPERLVIELKRNKKIGNKTKENPFRLPNWDLWLAI